MVRVRHTDLSCLSVLKFLLDLLSLLFYLFMAVQCLKLVKTVLSSKLGKDKCTSQQLKIKVNLVLFLAIRFAHIYFHVWFQLTDTINIMDKILICSENPKVYKYTAKFPQVSTDAGIFPVQL